MKLHSLRPVVLVVLTLGLSGAGPYIFAEEDQAALIRRGVEAWNRWRTANPDEIIILTGLEYPYAKLPGVNLREAAIELGDLSHADLSGANLSKAVLKQTRLERTNLSRADLREADLDGARLEGANLAGAQVTGANFADAYVDRTWTNLLKGTPGYDKIKWRGSGPSASDAPMPSGVAETIARMKKGNREWNRWRDANKKVRLNLNGADLTKVDLFNMRLNNTDLRNANMSGANLKYSWFSDSDLRGANLTKAYLSEVLLDNADLSGAILTGASLQRSRVDGIKLAGANLEGATLAGLSFKKTDLSGANLTRARLAFVNFEDSNLKDSNFSYVHMTGGFRNTTLTGADFRCASLDRKWEPLLRSAGVRNFDRIRWQNVYYKGECL